MTGRSWWRVILAVSRTNPLPEYPRPQLVRTQWQSLNGIWQFAGGPETPIIAGLWVTLLR